MLLVTQNVDDLLDRAGVDPALPFSLRGSGGMAKAVAAALRDRGHRVGTIVARNEDKGRALAAAYGFDWQEQVGDGAAVLVNATPIGMSGGDENALAFAPEVIARYASPAGALVLALQEQRAATAAR